MTRFPRLASTVLLAVVFVAAAETQEPRPVAAVDSIVQIGQRDGWVAGATRSVNDRLVIGFTTGFIAGLFGPAVIRAPLLGVAAITPVVWTLRAAGNNRANLPPALDQSIQDRPATYQRAYWIAYQDRGAQRRRRAARTGAVTGSVLGLGTLVWFISQINWGG